jgi:hypothetical protein
VAAGVRRPNDPVLLHGRHPREYLGPFRHHPGRRIGHLLDCIPKDDLPWLQADLLADLAGHQVVVSRDDLDLDPVGPQRPQCFGDPFVGGIEERGESHEHEVSFVGARIDRPLVDVAIGGRQHSVAFLTQPPKERLRSNAPFPVQGGDLPLELARGTRG